ncbi:MAG: hypothetical protein IVW57_00250 [Ktedonobacterales bacterium]|nr:hypothetical protein [Ktedonobacterales bacterium]
MAGEPILGKAHAEPHRDYKTLTWARLRRLRAWARRVADHEQAPVYLVGSALTTTRPRDLDVSIILPHDRFVTQFGPIPPNATTADEHRDPHMMPAYLDRLHHYLFVTQPYWKWMIDDGLYIGFTRIDLKICPDSWWPEKDRLLLAAPRQAKRNRP